MFTITVKFEPHFYTIVSRALDLFEAREQRKIDSATAAVVAVTKRLRTTRSALEDALNNLNQERKQNG